MPVPVQMRIPRLYRVDVLETPANFEHKLRGKKNSTGSPYLQFPGPEGLRWILDQAASKVPCGVI